MNRLAREKSPYLLQHADNPVGWYPWGEEAFAAARREDRPIFLSIGYSTCHWCHVMAHESFEDPSVAALLNEAFVPVKVDREERPDVDRLYMAYVQATTGSGGWPMSVWLAPDLRPFYGGTYFPPEPRWGRPAFVDVLRRISSLWRDDRGRVLAAAVGFDAWPDEAIAPDTADARLPEAVALSAAVDDLLARFDVGHGGFGGAPKFPRPSELLFLLREHHRAGADAARLAALRTLRAMAAGGVRDQIGGGFHRYSVDAAWRVPHFEKMLYDQAQLVLAFLEGAQATGDGDLLEVAEDTLRYVQREMTGVEGGFHSAEDADSVPAGAPRGSSATEGAFYLWTADEFGSLLGEDAGIAAMCLGVRPEGNAPHDPHGEFAGRNILYRAVQDEDAARTLGVDLDRVRAAVARARQALTEARGTRPRPSRDDKIVTAWNGLMIAACARAARVVGARGRADPSRRAAAATYLAAAERAARFIRDRLWIESTGTLLRRYRDGEAAIEAYAEDHASLVFGLLELFQSSGDPAWLEWALDLHRRQDELFWDDRDGGWFGTTGQDPFVRTRQKDLYDGAEPAASSLAALNALTIGQLTGDARAIERVARTLRAFRTRLEDQPGSVPMMLAVLSAWRGGPSLAVVVGEQGASDTVSLVDALDARYLPFTVRVVVDRDGPRRDRLAALLPSVSAMVAVDGRATAYVCRHQTCQAPTTDAGEMLRQLGAATLHG